MYAPLDNDLDLTPDACEPDCQMCGETSYFLGQLGNTYHFSCRYCGWQQSITTTKGE